MMLSAGQKPLPRGLPCVYFPYQGLLTSQALRFGGQGCSTLDIDEFSQAVDASQGCAVSVLAEGACAVGFVDFEAENPQAGEQRGVFAGA